MPGHPGHPPYRKPWVVIASRWPAVGCHCRRWSLVVHRLTHWRIWSRDGGFVSLNSAHLPDAVAGAGAAAVAVVTVTAVGHADAYAGGGAAGGGDPPSCRWKQWLPAWWPIWPWRWRLGRDCCRCSRSRCCCSWLWRRCYWHCCCHPPTATTVAWLGARHAAEDSDWLACWAPAITGPVPMTAGWVWLHPVPWLVRIRPRAQGPPTDYGAPAADPCPAAHRRVVPWPLCPLARRRFGCRHWPVGLVRLLLVLLFVLVLSDPLVTVRFGWYISKLLRSEVCFHLRVPDVSVRFMIFSAIYYPLNEVFGECVLLLIVCVCSRF